MEEHPHRGDRGAYDRYLAGMDASVRQKVALTAAHLLCEGRIADMGMGSGTGSHALAALYPALEVVGVDVDPEMVERARERHVLPNLSFVVGDIAERVFEPGSLDGIFDSSVLHHVTTFGGYEHAAAARALEAQAAQLRDGGTLIVRDFVDPGPGDVWLDLPTDDGDDSDDPRSCSTAHLFERFAREFRSLHAEPGFSFERLDGSDEYPVRDGWRRYRLSHTLAAEFVLRKDYRRDWEAEVKEEYTYLTQEGFEAAYGRLGLRVLASTPIRNPWIVRNRFVGRFELRDVEGEPLEVPATNYVIAGEKVPDGEGVSLRDAGPAQPMGFLALEHWRDRERDQVLDLVWRPNRTLDVLPWFEADGDLFVLARGSYPRPILRADVEGHRSLDGSRASGWVTEPLNVIQTDRPVGQTVERMLSERASLEAEQLHGFERGSVYYPSPGGVQEEVASVFVRVDPVFVEERLDNLTQFSTSGRVRAIEARQLLRAAQVGGLPDARLELNAYDLLGRRGRGPGPWIGEAIEPSESKAPSPSSWLDVAARPARRRFTETTSEASAGFLDLRCSRFEELDASGTVVGSTVLEYVVPSTLGLNTVACAPLRRSGDEVFLGLDDDDLPAAQAFSGNSQILVAPAWRLPREVSSPTPARELVRARFEREYDVKTGEIWELGGRYHPSAGVTPEVVHPLAVEVRADGPDGRALTWLPLRSIRDALPILRDGHLRIVALRAAHALGFL